ncbi:hypothetical protein GGI23_007251, partial [Coemansia sp. RSA 2559]
INNPVAGTVWPYNGNSVTISWISSNGAALTGTVSVQLMEGTDSNNLSPVYTVATNYDASKGSVSFVPPSNLDGSSNYAVRVTSSVDGPHYSHFFQAGNPAITGAASSAVTVSQTSNSNTSDEASSTAKASSTAESSSASADESSSPKVSDSSADELSNDVSDEDESSGDSSLEKSSEESSEESSSDKDSKSSGASRPVIAAGIIGAAAIAALF